MNNIAIKQFNLAPVRNINIPEMMEMELTLLQNWLFQLDYEGAIVILNKMSICVNIFEFNKKYKWN